MAVDPWSEFKDADTAVADPWDEFQDDGVPDPKQVVAEPEGPGFLESTFPSTTEALKNPSSVGAQEQIGIGALSDVMTIPARAAAAAFTDQKFSDPNAYVGRGAVENHQTNTAKEVPGESPQDALMRMRREGTTAAPEQFTKPIMEFGVRTATDPLSYAGLVTPGLKATGAAGKVLNKGSGKLAQELSGVSEEALRLGSTKAGRQALREASGKQAEIGQKISDAVGDFHEYLPEKEVVQEALKRMPEVDISGVLESLNKAKMELQKGAQLPYKKDAIRAIDAHIQGIRRGRNGFPKTKMSAEEAYQLRRELDYNLDFDKPETKLVERALKDARYQLKNDLLASAGKSGNKEYAEAMKEWSRKLNLLEKINSRLGLTKNTREARSEAFVKNLFGKNSANKQELMKDLDEVFGTDLLKQSRMTFLADEIGDGGKAAILPRQTTGRATLATAGGALASGIGAGPAVGTAVGLGLAAHASPFVASRGVLPATQAVEAALNNGIFKTARSKSLAKAYLKTTSTAVKTRIAEQLSRQEE